MGLNFRKMLSLGKLFRVNITKKGIGISAGVKGVRAGIGPRGIRRTVSLPGTGIYWTKQNSLKKKKQHNSDADSRKLTEEGSGAATSEFKQNWKNGPSQQNLRSAYPQENIRNEKNSTNQHEENNEAGTPEAVSKQELDRSAEKPFITRTKIIIFIFAVGLYFIYRGGALDFAFLEASYSLTGVGEPALADANGVTNNGLAAGRDGKEGAPGEGDALTAGSSELAGDENAATSGSASNEQHGNTDKESSKENSAGGRAEGDAKNADGSPIDAAGSSVNEDEAKAVQASTGSSNANTSEGAQNQTNSAALLEMRDETVQLDSDTIFVASKAGEKFHLLTCRVISTIFSRNLVQYSYLAEAQREKDPCSICGPAD